MGDGEKAPLRLQFNPKVRLEFRGAAITSDAGLLAFRELDDALGLTRIAADYLKESRTGRNIRHHLVPLAGTSQGLLTAPVVLVEDAPYLGGMVLDPEVASDNLGHPGLRPDVAAKAKGLGSLGQQFQQLEPLLVGQLGPPAGRLAVVQGLGTVGPGPAEPLADGIFSINGGKTSVLKTSATVCISLSP